MLEIGMLSSRLSGGTRTLGSLTYLAEAAGTPQIFEIVDETGKSKGTRPPKIVTEENPPTNHIDALRRWNVARQRFYKSIRKKSVCSF